MITLYTTDCPQCKVLEKKLDAKNISFQKNTSVKEMLSKGIASAPVLEVDGQLLNFAAANAWINEQ